MHVTNEICQLEWEETGDFCQPYYSAEDLPCHLLCPPHFTEIICCKCLFQLLMSHVPCAIQRGEGFTVKPCLCSLWKSRKVSRKSSLTSFFKHLLHVSLLNSQHVRTRDWGGGVSMKEWLLLPCLWSLLCVHKNTSSQNSRVVGRPNSKRPTGETKVLETALEKWTWLDDAPTSYKNRHSSLELKSPIGFSFAGDLFHDTATIVGGKVRTGFDIFSPGSRGVSPNFWFDPLRLW